MKTRLLITIDRGPDTPHDECVDCPHRRIYTDHGELSTEDVCSNIIILPPRRARKFRVTYDACSYEIDRDYDTPLVNGKRTKACLDAEIAATKVPTTD